MKNFRCYQLAKSQYLSIRKVKLPRYQADQIQRASLSVCLNLAEGSAKASVKDRRRFYEMALASHREVQALIDLIPLAEQAGRADTLGGGLFNLVPRHAKLYSFACGRPKAHCRSGLPVIGISTGWHQKRERAQLGSFSK